MQALDFISFPLQGHSLIEASAGTGKTYTITNLYLRLVLGIDCPARDVENILVVTFTNAATAELKGRIRDKLRQAYVDLLQGHSDDPVLGRLMAQLHNTQLALARLDYALQKLDQASVMTIHGFCQRMLSEHAFESGAPYAQQMILDESDWLTLAAEDYWRRYILTLERAPLTQVYGIWSGPDELLAELRSLLYRQVTPLTPSQNGQSTWLEMLSRYQQTAQRAKAWWLQNDVAGQLREAGLKANAKVGKEQVLSAMTAFCQRDDLSLDWDAKGWGLFAAENVAKARKKDSKDLSHLDFSRFDDLQELSLACDEACRLAILTEALGSIRSALSQHKQRLNLIAPDDLLSQLANALESDGGETLAHTIATQFPVGLIDEFQDTDPVQYDIFTRIYSDPQKSSLIVIGDPKQAIYGFRGADIHTYIRAKSEVPPERHFTLDRNWRSAPLLVAAVNHVFASSAAGFLYQEAIPFMPVGAGQKHNGLARAGTSDAPLAFHLYRPSDAPLSWSQVQVDLARQCAADICQWLRASQKGQVELEAKPLKAGDVCVLVRDRHEAMLVKEALAAQDIASVFLVRRSVFSSPLAYQLYLVTKALANPRRDTTVRSALATELIGIDAHTMDQWLRDDVRWQGVLDNFYHWHRLWQSHGIAQALSELIEHFAIGAKLVNGYEDGLRRLTDLRHLTELLQEQSNALQGEAQLLRYFYEQLASPDDNHDAQQLRLESDANLVQIVTLHASKGLEYPLVWIPFACRGKAAQQAVYHQPGQGLIVDFLGQEQSLLRADYERQAEDIRLLYVGLTRAAGHCAVGVWHNAASGRRGQSGLLQTALGSVLLSGNESPSTDDLVARLSLLAEHEGIALIARNEVSEVQPLEPPAVKTTELQTATLQRPLQQNWRVTSYSALSLTQSQAQHEVLAPGWDEVHEPSPEPVDRETLNRFSFPRGAKPGSFLHGVLERIDFTAPVSIDAVIAQQSQWFGIDESWAEITRQWLLETLQTPLPGGFCLAQLTAQNTVVEMEFYLPLQQVQADAFNRLLARYLGKANYQFDQLSGMLKGYIDLTLCWDGRYYVADYKSNHLGDSTADYGQEQLEHAMVEHDYQLQAVLYTLALHRWLSTLLPNYDYDQHIGGALYLFLRGMDHSGTSGVYYTKADKALILALDKLFAGQEHTSEPQQISLWDS